ncbi:MAG TPA: hypothetical protein VFG07_08495 [Thermoplasmata archaeon]|nr:hypothetical protein [Thermoplasmata archaeon]
MSGRPPGSPSSPTLRLEILKELQLLIENREARDRVDRSPLAETKGREHWLLHLLLRADESMQAHTDTLIGTAYANLLARLQALDDRLDRMEERDRTSSSEVKEELAQVSKGFGEKVDLAFDRGVVRIEEGLQSRLSDNLDEKWKPIGESVEQFAQGSRQVLKDVADTYRVATQTRLLLNENARRITDLGRDLVALEESLKLVVSKTLEEGLAPLEQRVAALENHLGLVAVNGRPANERAGNSPPEPGQ